MALDLSPEQQEIFDRVVGIVTQNDELRHQFKTAIDELHKQPNWDDVQYISDSKEPAAVNFRAAFDRVKEVAEEVEPTLKTTSPILFGQICSVVCDNFRKS